MSEPASIATGIAARYALAVFELARQDKALAQLEADNSALSAALADSADFRALIASPVYSRAQLGDAIMALGGRMNLSPLMSNTLGLMARNRRLFALPQLTEALRNLIATEKGEVTVDVVSAKALTKTQSDRLSGALKASIGKTIKIKSTVDEKLIGGLVVKVGSRMIDTSIRSKLSNLQNSMKEVG